MFAARFLGPGSTPGRQGKDSPIKTIFKQDALIGIKALVYIVIACLLMLADHKNIFFHKVRERAAVVVTPIEYTVDWPIELVRDVVADIETQHSLLKENAKLKAQLLLLHAKNQQMLAIQNENAELQQLLQSSAKAGGRVLESQILAVSSDPYLHQVVIDKGLQQGVYQGQPVLDSTGVMGQVIQVGETTSRVMLITDADSAVPVQDSRSGIRSIAIGNARLGSLELQNVTSTEDIKKGDLLIASGLGQRYPYGYPVGTVTDVQKTTGDAFMKVALQPAAQLNRSRVVMLVWPVHVKIDKKIKKALKDAAKPKEDLVHES